MGMYPNGLSLPMPLFALVVFFFFMKSMSFFFCSGEAFNWCHEAEVDEAGMVGKVFFLFVGQSCQHVFDFLF